MTMSPMIMLKQDIRIALTQTQMLQLRLYAGELEDKIYGPQLTIKEFVMSACPKCKTVTIWKPDGVFLKCLHCSNIFSESQAAALAFYEVRRVGEESIIQTPKYDFATLKDKISGVSPFITPSALHNADIGLYINIIHQLGSLSRAFASVGITYANPAKECWQNTIIDYVGILTDGEIAKIVGVSRTTIWIYRQRFGIPTAGQNFEDLPITPESVEEIRKYNNQKLQEDFNDWKKTLFRDIRSVTKRLIEENPEKSDREICNLLKEQGFQIARRTVNKYRLEEREKALKVS